MMKCMLLFRRDSGPGQGRAWDADGRTCWRVQVERNGGRWSTCSCPPLPAAGPREAAPWNQVHSQLSSWLPGRTRTLRFDPAESFLASRRARALQTVQWHLPLQAVADVIIGVYGAPVRTCEYGCAAALRR
ncbi:hypothetical protein M758_1G073800 [Ceratodon purpureus]|nr:hypothetical protein M758_1G073800 [Ceratodon purpureus]